MPEKTLQIKTERLLLLPLGLSQLKRMLAAEEPLEQVLGFPACPSLITAPVIEALEIQIDRMITLDESQHAWFTFWLMTLQDEEMVVGMLGFKGAPGADGEVEIGYGVCPEHEGRGYTTEAVRALLSWAFSQPGCNTVMAETLKDNLASMRVLQKAGMQYAGECENLLIWRIHR